MRYAPLVWSLVVVKSFRHLIAHWETKVAFARDVGVGYEAAKMWAARNNIRPEHWRKVQAAARRRGIHLSTDDCLRMSRPRRPATATTRRQSPIA